MNQATTNKSQRLFLELGSALQLSPEDPDRAVAGELMGMRVGQYLIVRVSEKNWHKAGPTPDETLQVRYILSDDVLGFNTRIIRTVQNPDYLIFLAYPEDVESCNIRSQKRVECFLPTQMILDNHSLESIIININKNGCLAQVENCPKLECCRLTPVTLKLSYGQFDTLTLEGDIRTETRKGTLSKFGILFKDLDGFSRKVLATLVPALNF